MIVNYAVYRLAGLKVTSNVAVLDLDSLSESTPYLRTKEADSALSLLRTSAKIGQGKVTREERRRQGAPPSEHHAQINLTVSLTSLMFVTSIRRSVMSLL